MTRFVMLVLVAACSSPAPVPPGEVRPERLVESDDGLAFLWLPDGGAAADADIRVTARHVGGVTRYELTPSGLVFSPPAWLLVKTAADETPDAGIALPKAALRSDDGTSEAPVMIHVAPRGGPGAVADYSLIRVPHFSTLELGRDVTAPAQPYLVVKGAERFEAKQGAEVNVELTFEHVGQVPAIDGLSGQLSVLAGGAVDVVTPVDGPLPGTFVMPGKLALRLRCARGGEASYTLRVVSPFFHQAMDVRVSGRCAPSALATVLTSSAPPPSAEPDTYALLGFARIFLDAAGELGEANGFTPSEADLERIKAKFTRPAPTLSAKLTLECSSCRIEGPKTATLELTPGVALEAVSAHLQAGEAIVAEAPATVGFSPSTLAAGAKGSATLRFRCTTGGMGLMVFSTVVKIAGQEQRAHVLNQAGTSDLHVVRCEGGQKGDAIMLSDNTRVTRSGGAWSLAAPGVTANVILAAQAVEDRFAPVSASSIAYGGVTAFGSVAGLSPLRLRSSLQTATATHNGTRYALTGLTAGAAYSGTDTLTVEHQPAAGPLVTVSVPAPPPVGDVNALLGAPAGWGTTVSVHDGAFDTLYVFVGLRPPGTSTGEFGLMRFARAADLPLANGRRSSPLLDAATRAEVEALGFTVTSLYVAYFNTVETTAFFPGQRAVPVQAGRMLQLVPAELGL
ncbi:MAG: hypothetical protein JNK82_21890 [Myxococcaceae bacterium]|nr:hypothetical protein [Myxococcaceae bacterium]